MAAILGSDVPFLVGDEAMAMSWGRGERLLAVKPLPPRELELFFPPFGVNSAEAYAMLDAQRGEYAGPGPELTTEMFRDWESAARTSTNDFEAVMRPRHPEIDALLARGEKYGQFYRMTGSGSTVFKVSGVSTRSTLSDAEPQLVLPEGTERIFTRTAWSVVPVELLD
jgi:4-diphosphocytidyl-2C-methyl-D-erythritol kinase